MKRLVAILLSLIILFSFSIPTFAKSTYVKGYYRKDGTYVSGHYRHYGGSSYTSNNSNVNNLDDIDYTRPKISQNSIVRLYKGKEYVGTKSKSNLVFIHGYYREDGVYVRPHWRTNKDNYIENNFSYYGYSTLKPLPFNQYYKNYNFELDCNKGTAGAERYLLYNSLPINSNLNYSQLSYLKTYAKSLRVNTSDTEVSNNCFKFYSSLGLNDIYIETLFNFDKTGDLTSLSYLLFNLLDTVDISTANKYANSLCTYGLILELNSLNLLGERNQAIVNAFASMFYNNLLSPDEIKLQAELDSLQKFTSTVFSQEDLQNLAYSIIEFTKEAESLSDEELSNLYIKYYNSFFM